MHPLLGLLLAYVVGSIPFAFLAGKLTRGIDLRQHGSGNLGATNVFRVLGWKIGVPVFVLDIAKGAVPAGLFPLWTLRVAFPFLPAAEAESLWGLAFGVAAIVGHVRPVFLLWRGGGKGVATATGVFLALAPIALLVAFSLWVAILLASGYVSLASILAAVVLPVLLAFTNGVDSPLFAVGIALALFVVWTHRANIGRLRRGEEHRFGRRRAEAAMGAHEPRETQ